MLHGVSLWYLILTIVFYLCDSHSGNITRLGTVQQFNPGNPKDNPKVNPTVHSVTPTVNSYESKLNPKLK